MHIAILGAGGMIGHKLAQQLLDDKKLGNTPIKTLELLDVADPQAASFTNNSKNIQLVTSAFNLTNSDDIHRLIEKQPDVIVHLAAIVSVDAEQNFEKGYVVNLDGTRTLFEAIRKKHLENGYCPRLPFASSGAVFGAPFPDVIPDDFHTKPLTSYGTQKAMTEMLLADYSRRGFFEGIGIRLPTISVRPGKPNKAASGFFSGIIREPLNGQQAVLPVPENIRHWHASPRSAVGFFIHAASLDYKLMDHHYNLSMPGVSCTVGEQIEALRAVAGEEVCKLIVSEPDAQIMEIVSNWAPAFAAERAKALGFVAENNFAEIVQVYIDDELGGKL